MNLHTLIHIFHIKKTIDLPTTGLVVRTEPRAQPMTSQVEGLSQEEKIRQVAVNQISMHMEQMLP